MDKFWQGHSSTTLRGRKQGPVEFFYQHSWAHPPPSPLSLSPAGTMWVCWDENIFKNIIHFLYQVSVYMKTMETSNFVFFILQFVILVSAESRQGLYRRAEWSTAVIRDQVRDHDDSKPAPVIGPFRAWK